MAARLGIDARAAGLTHRIPGVPKNRSALERLISPDQMGELFKVVAIHSPDWPVPAGFA